MARHSPSISLKEKALQLLSARDYSRSEMQNKLQQWLLLRERSAARRLVQRQQSADNEDANFDADDAFCEENAKQSAQMRQLAQSAQEQVEQQSAQIPALLDELQERGYLNDQRAAEALMRRRASKLGGMRLRQELQRKGISDTISTTLLAEAANDEKQRAVDVWQKKFGVFPASLPERAKQMRFLANRGFSGDVIRYVMQQAERMREG